MFHFFTKIGRKPWAKGIVPIATMAVTSSYIGFHTFGHSFVCKYFGAQSQESGRREELSQELRDLIKSVHADVKETLGKQLLPDPTGLFNPHDITMRWFASATLEPINIGISEFRSGLSIGLPSFYNYKSIDDVPDSILQVRQISFMKSMTQKTADDDAKQELESALEAVGEKSTSLGKVIRIQKDTQSGQNYIHSLVLSEDAKRFSIARELYYADNYRPLVVVTTIMISSFFSLAASRYAILKYNLMDRHFTQRLPFYIVSGGLAAIMFGLMTDSVNDHYTRKADFRAISLNENYRQGAMEYFSKIILRHKALREEVKGMDNIYDSEGNFKENGFRQRHVPYTERLKMAEVGPTEELKKKLAL